MEEKWNINDCWNQKTLTFDLGLEAFGKHATPPPRTDWNTIIYGIKNIRVFIKATCHYKCHLNPILKPHTGVRWLHLCSRCSLQVWWLHYINIPAVIPDSCSVLVPNLMYLQYCCQPSLKKKKKSHVENTYHSLRTTASLLLIFSPSWTCINCRVSEWYLRSSCIYTDVTASPNTGTECPSADPLFMRSEVDKCPDSA